MKIKTSITLSEDLLETVDEFAARYNNRSEFLEIIIRKMIAQMVRDEQNERDLQIINENADRLNREVEDALAYQVIP